MNSPAARLTFELTGPASYDWVRDAEGAVVERPVRQNDNTKTLVCHFVLDTRKPKLSSRKYVLLL